MNEPLKLISVVIPFRNESKCVEKFFVRLRAAVKNISYDFEFICIDDGSTDDTLDLLKKEQKVDFRIKILSFSRNFGKEAALTAGLEKASGIAVVPIDSDLQHPPEIIADMIKKWEEGYKVVVAVPRIKHRPGIIRKYLTLGFYKITHYLSDVPLIDKEGDFRLVDAKVVEIIKKMPEKNRFMKGIFSWVGFKKTTVNFEQDNRVDGENKWSFFQLWQLALDGFFSLTTVPLKIWTYVGISISLLSFTYIVIILLKVLFYGADVPGYASMITVMLFLGGIQLISLGIIGEYIGRIYIETKARPNYVIEEFLEISKDINEKINKEKSDSDC